MVSDDDAKSLEDEFIVDKGVEHASGNSSDSGDDSDSDISLNGSEKQAKKNITQPDSSSVDSLEDMNVDGKPSPKKVEAKALPKKVNSCGGKTISHKAKKSDDKDASAKTARYMMQP